MTEKQSRILTWTGWLSYLLAILLIIIRIKTGNYCSDWLIKLDFVVALSVTVTALVILFLCDCESKKLTTICFGGFLCPLTLAVVIFSMFMVIPTENGHIVERDGPDSAEYIEGAYWLNPFTDKVFDYRTQGIVRHDRIKVTYDYAGTELDLHKKYRGKPEAFMEYANQRIIQIIDASTQSYLGEPRIDQLHFLFHELPKVLPKDIIFSGKINVVFLASMKGPVVDVPEAEGR